MAKKNDTPQVSEVKAEKRLDGFEMVDIVSTGSAPTMRVKGKIHSCDATMAQVLIDKGYATLKK